MADAYRFTFTVTPLTTTEAQAVVNDIRARFGRKPLIHVLGRQPSETPVDVAPRAIPAPEPDWSALRDACDEYCTAYMGEDDSLMPPALDKIRAALRGEDPYNPTSAGGAK